MTGRIIAAGLGPAGPDLVTSGVAKAIDSIPHQYLRTARHPAAELLAGADNFDHHYEAAASFDEVYRNIAEDLVGAADRHGEVLYAVPGSPAVLERTVELLRAAAAEGRCQLEVLPALSFADLAWARLAVDPLEAGVRLVDGHRFAIAAAGERGPLLVGHCHNRRVLSDIKLAVEEPPTEPVTVLARLGLPDEWVSEVAWDDLDRSVKPDHLTSLYVPTLAVPVAGELAAFAEVVTRLRAECPWDRTQTHASLRRYLREESGEVLEALDRLIAVLDRADEDGTVLDEAYAHLEEELGDLLFQVGLHSELATEAGRFTLADVARGIHDKMVRRHPHVFAGAEYDPDAWSRLKAAERAQGSSVTRM